MLAADYKSVYSYGLPFSKKLGENLDAQVHRVKKVHKASMIIIDGALGEGKTTLGVEVADYLMQRWFEDEQGNLNNNVKTDLAKQYSMGGDDFQEKLKICYDSKLPVLIYDEAGDFSSRGALTQFNRRLNRVFETYRTFKIIVILILPFFRSLDNSIFDKRIPRMLLNCHDRNQKYGNFRAYSLKKMFYMKWMIPRMKVPAAVYSKEMPNFRGHYYDLSDVRGKELSRISTKGKLDIVSENILANKGLISYKQLAKKVGRTVSWCRQKISELNIESTTTYKRKKYFSPETVEVLMSEKS